MVKGKIYRTLGWVLFILGTLICLSLLVEADFSKGVPVVVYNTLGQTACNIFIWAGLFFLWRADKIKSPDKKSKWLQAIKLYAIFTAIMLASTILFGLFPHLLPGRP